MHILTKLEGCGCANFHLNVLYDNLASEMRLRKLWLDCYLDLLEVVGCTPAVTRVKQKKIKYQ